LALRRSSVASDSTRLETSVSPARAIRLPRWDGTTGLVMRCSLLVLLLAPTGN
jgi:hypothetical protein